MKIRLLSAALLATCVVLTAATSQALACASCGSGGDSPLILYPNESYKAYLGMTRQSGFETVYEDGKVGAESGPTQRVTAVAAIGKTFHPDFFATLTAPYVTNSRDGTSKSGVGDPLVSVHWTVLPASVLATNRPQIQVIGAYKRASGRSVLESEDLYGLDVFGSGYDEARLGTDVWWGNGSIKGGGAHVMSIPRAREIQGAKRSPGMGQRTTATLGYGWSDMGKVLVGLTRDARDAQEVDGEEIANSESRNHSVFLTGDAKVGMRGMGRLTVARSAVIGQNKNTARALSFTMSYMVSM